MKEDLLKKYVKEREVKVPESKFNEKNKELSAIIILESI